MNSHLIKLSIDKPFGNLYRKDTILIIIRDENGNFLFGNKPDYYPIGITRLFGGGVKQGESIKKAALREISEELSININIDDLIDLPSIKVRAIDSLSRHYAMNTHLFFYQLKSGERINAGDDVKSIAYLTKEEVNALVIRYKSLPKNLWREQDGESYSWYDYGQLYGYVHEMAFLDLFNLIPNLSR